MVTWLAVLQERVSRGYMFSGQLCRVRAPRVSSPRPGSRGLPHGLSAAKALSQASLPFFKELYFHPRILAKRFPRSTEDPCTFRLDFLKGWNIRNLPSLFVNCAVQTPRRVPTCSQLCSRRPCSHLLCNFKIKGFSFASLQVARFCCSEGGGLVFAFFLKATRRTDRAQGF